MNHASLVLEFYRQLEAIELEAKQFGLAVDEAYEDDSPLVSVIGSADLRREVKAGVAEWKRCREKIQEMYSIDSVDALPKKESVYAARLAEILAEIKPINQRCLEIISAELLDNLKGED